MKKILLLSISTSVLLGCMALTSKKDKDRQHQQQVSVVDNAAVSMRLYDELFRLIDLNDSGQMLDSEFKPQADLVKQKIDANDLRLTANEKARVKSYGNILLEKLILDKMARDNNN